MVRTLFAAALSLTIAVSLVSTARAVSIVDNSTVTIYNNAPAFPGYPATDAIDTGAGHQLTDYASLSQGVNTFLDFDFGSAVRFLGIQETDRVSSGGGNGTFVGGTSEFNTDYTYIFSNDPTFATNVGTVTVSRGVPASPTGPADFATLTAISSITARYVRWDVTGVNGSSLNTGANNGASDFLFVAAPEPSSFVLAGLATVGLVGYRVRRRRAG